MFEFTSVLVGIVALSLLISLIFAWRAPSDVEVADAEPVGYSFTVWAEKKGSTDSAVPINRVQPQKITAEYSVLLQAHSPEELSAAQHESAQWAIQNFRHHFEPILGEIDIGAVHCEPDAVKDE